MRAAILTREWPPHIYGGAGVHVAELVRNLRALLDVDVYCMGEPRSDAFAVPLVDNSSLNPALAVVQADVQMAQAVADAGAEVVHSHTWYANLAGQLASRLLDVPHILTAHSLEPRRPWKAEQLGGGYRVSSAIESDAYRSAAAIIAVSEGMRTDLLDCYPFVDPQNVQVVHNGVDSSVFTPTTDLSVLEKFGIDPARPYVLFVGRITRQKGLIHLLRAAARLPNGVQLVLAASSPDEPAIGAEVSAAIDTLRAARPRDVVWIEEMVSKRELVALLSQAAVFACPSVYEPLGIVNLEAMACGTAVVASAVGGIPEVVEAGVTGLLVDYDPNRVTEFEDELAQALTRVVENPELAQTMGSAGRQRALDHFDWSAIARRTLSVYQSVL